MSPQGIICSEEHACLHTRYGNEREGEIHKTMRRQGGLFFPKSYKTCLQDQAL